MASFDATSAITSSVVLDGDEFYEFSIGLLPEFITDSSLFIMTIDMCPDSTTFPFLKSKIPMTLKISSKEDFQRLIEADHMFGFTSKTQILILESMYEFWLNDPNSSELPLPVKDFSHFGNQVRALFMETNNITTKDIIYGDKKIKYIHCKSEELLLKAFIKSFVNSLASFFLTSDKSFF